LRSGHFASQEDVARALKIAPSQVSRMLRFAKLPSVVLNAFATPLEICEAWGLEIMAALDDPQRRQRTIQAARSLGDLNPRPPAKRVYRELIAASADARQPKLAAGAEIVRDRQGAPLFRVRQLSTSVSLVISTAKLSETTLAEIRTALAGILQPSIHQRTRTERKRGYSAPTLDSRVTIDRCAEPMTMVEMRSCLPSD
jgi:hypothetical protein